ncbi:M48 family metalloprotease [Ensifer sp. ENS05]|nr:M48 family metalloprotease [Ensifer sp. ENS05]
MSRMILAAGRRFGRFAVFLFVLPAALLFSLWLSLLEHLPGWFLATAVIMLPVAMLAIAFLLGILFAGVRRSKVSGMTRAEAPGLWSIWEKVAGSRIAARTIIHVDDELNASIGVERPLFGLLGSRYVLTVGIPLLAVTDEDAITTILAHENAHLRNRDVNGSLRLAELENTFDFVFSYASPEGTISGRLLYDLLGFLGESFDLETARLSREAEIKADRDAASSGRSERAARALLLIASASEFLRETVHEPLRTELMGAVSPPSPPLKRVLQAAHKLTDQAVINTYALRAWDVPVDEKASHPSWAQRLSALGYSEAPQIEPVTTTALSSLLDESTSIRMTEAFDKAWTSRIANFLQW